MLAVGLLFYALAYLTVGGLTALFLRLVGLPDVSHNHDGDCYEQLPYDRSTFITKRGKRICKPRMGGKPFELILWIIWTLAWPVPILFSLWATVIWLLYKGLWIKF